MRNVVWACVVVGAVLVGVPWQAALALLLFLRVALPKALAWVVNRRMRAFGRVSVARVGLGRLSDVRIDTVHGHTIKVAAVNASLRFSRPYVKLSADGVQVVAGSGHALPPVEPAAPKPKHARVVPVQLVLRLLRAACVSVKNVNVGVGKVAAEVRSVTLCAEPEAASRLRLRVVGLHVHEGHPLVNLPLVDVCFEASPTPGFPLQNIDVDVCGGAALTCGDLGRVRGLLPPHKAPAAGHVPPERPPVDVNGLLRQVAAIGAAVHVNGVSLDITTDGSARVEAALEAHFSASTAGEAAKVTASVTASKVRVTHGGDTTVVAIPSATLGLDVEAPDDTLPMSAVFTCDVQAPAVSLPAEWLRRRRPRPGADAELRRRPPRAIMANIHVSPLLTVCDASFAVVRQGDALCSITLTSLGSSGSTAVLSDATNPARLLSSSTAFAASGLQAALGRLPPALHADAIRVTTAARPGSQFLTVTCGVDAPRVVVAPPTVAALTHLAASCRPEPRPVANRPPPTDWIVGSRLATMAVVVTDAALAVSSGPTLSAVRTPSWWASQDPTVAASRDAPPCNLELRLGSLRLCAGGGRAVTAIARHLFVGCDGDVCATVADTRLSKRLRGNVPAAVCVQGVRWALSVATVAKLLQLKSDYRKPAPTTAAVPPPPPRAVVVACHGMRGVVRLSPHADDRLRVTCASAAVSTASSPANLTVTNLRLCAGAHADVLVLPVLCVDVSKADSGATVAAVQLDGPSVHVPHGFALGGVLHSAIQQRKLLKRVLRALASTRPSATPSPVRATVVASKLLAVVGGAGGATSPPLLAVGCARAKVGIEKDDGVDWSGLRSRLQTQTSSPAPSPALYATTEGLRLDVDVRDAAVTVGTGVVRWRGRAPVCVRHDRRAPLLTARRLSTDGARLVVSQRAPDKPQEEATRATLGNCTIHGFSNPQPVKLYHDVSVAADGVAVHVDSPTLKALKAVSGCVSTLLPKPRDAPPSTTTPLPWWDSVRYLAHGRFAFDATEVGVTASVRGKPPPAAADGPAVPPPVPAGSGLRLRVDDVRLRAPRGGLDTYFQGLAVDVVPAPAQSPAPQPDSVDDEPPLPAAGFPLASVPTLSLRLAADWATAGGQAPDVHYFYSSDGADPKALYKSTGVTASVQVCLGDAEDAREGQAATLALNLEGLPTALRTLGCLRPPPAPRAASFQEAAAMRPGLGSLLHLGTLEVSVASPGLEVAVWDAADAAHGFLAHVDQGVVVYAPGVAPAFLSAPGPGSPQPVMLPDPKDFLTSETPRRGQARPLQSPTRSDSRWVPPPPSPTAAFVMSPTAAAEWRPIPSVRLAGMRAWLLHTVPVEGLDQPPPPRPMWGASPCPIEAPAATYARVRVLRSELDAFLADHTEAVASPLSPSPARGALLPSAPPFAAAVHPLEPPVDAAQHLVFSLTEARFGRVVTRGDGRARAGAGSANTNEDGDGDYEDEEEEEEEGEEEEEEVGDEDEEEEEEEEDVGEDGIDENPAAGAREVPGSRRWRPSLASVVGPVAAAAVAAGGAPLPTSPSDTAVPMFRVDTQGGVATILPRSSTPDVPPPSRDTPTPTRRLRAAPSLEIFSLRLLWSVPVRDAVLAVSAGLVAATSNASALLAPMAVPPPPASKAPPSMLVGFAPMAGGGAPPPSRTLRRTARPGAPPLAALETPPLFTGGGSVVTSRVPPPAAKPRAAPAAAGGAATALTTVPEDTAGGDSVLPSLGLDLSFPGLASGDTHHTNASVLQHVLQRGSTGPTPRSSVVQTPIRAAGTDTPTSMLSPVTEGSALSPRDGDHSLTLSWSHSYLPDMVLSSEGDEALEATDPSASGSGMSGATDPFNVSRVSSIGAPHGSVLDTSQVSLDTSAWTADSPKAGDDSQPPADSGDDERTSSLRPRLTLRVKLIRPQIAFHDVATNNTCLVAPRSARLHLLRGPVAQASKAYLRESRRPPPRTQEGGVAGYTGEDPIRMEREAQVLLRGVVAFMTPTNLDADTALAVPWLPDGHTADVTARLQRDEAAMRGDVRGQQPPAAGSDGGDSDASGGGAIRALHAAHASTKDVLRCVLVDAQVQCVHQSFMYEWTDSGLPKKEHRSILSVNLPDRAEDAATSGVSLFLDSSQFYGMLDIVKRVLLAPVPAPQEEDAALPVFRTATMAETVTVAAVVAADLPTFSTQALLGGSITGSTAGTCVFVTAPVNGVGGRRVVVTPGQLAASPRGRLSLGGTPPAVAVEWPGDVPVKGLVEKDLDGRGAPRGGAVSVTRVRVIEYMLSKAELVMTTEARSPMAALAVSAFHGRHEFRADGGTNVDMSLGWLEMYGKPDGFGGLAPGGGGAGVHSTPPLVPMATPVGVNTPPPLAPPRRAPVAQDGRPHILGARLFGDNVKLGRQRFVQIEAKTLAPSYPLGADGPRVNVYEHIGVAVFPNATHCLVLSVSKPQADWIKEYFFTGGGGDDVAPPGFDGSVSPASEVATPRNAFLGSAGPPSTAPCVHDFGSTRRVAKKSEPCGWCGATIGRAVPKGFQKCSHCRTKMHTKCVAPWRASAAAGDTDTDSDDGRRRRAASVATTASSPEESPTMPTRGLELTSPPPGHHRRSMSMADMGGGGSRLASTQSTRTLMGPPVAHSGASVRSISSMRSHRRAVSMMPPSVTAKPGTPEAKGKRREAVYFRHIRLERLDVAVSLHKFKLLKVDGARITLQHYKLPAHGRVDAKGELWSWFDLAQSIRSHLVHQAWAVTKAVGKRVLRLSGKSAGAVVPQAAPSPATFELPRSLKLVAAKIHRRAKKRRAKELRRRRAASTKGAPAAAVADAGDSVVVGGGVPVAATSRAHTRRKSKLLFGL